MRRSSLGAPALGDDLTLGVLMTRRDPAAATRRYPEMLARRRGTVTTKRVPHGLLS